MKAHEFTESLNPKDDERIKIWFNFKTGRILKGFTNHLIYAKNFAELFGFERKELESFEGDANRDLVWKLSENNWARVSMTRDEIDVDTTDIKNVHKTLMMLSKRIRLPNILYFDTKTKSGHLENNELKFFLNKGRLPNDLPGNY